MTSRSRLGILVLCLAALLVAAEPAVHHHQLLPGSADGVSTSLLCSICVTGASHATLTTVASVAPLVAGETLLALLVTAVSHETPLALPSRAPPAR
jgi:hypothetical protein